MVERKWYSVEKMHWGCQVMIFLALTLVIYGCIEPFSPPEVNNTERFLVVDGFLNVGSDTSRITLRNTQNTNDDTRPITEGAARISAEAESGETYNFEEKGEGVYVLPPVNFNMTTKYRLHIRRSNGSEYFSEYVSVTKTPPIDSLTYKLDTDRNAMLIYVNTHDPANNTRFYRWRFEETFEYRTAYFSGLVRDPETESIISRRDNINTCWSTLESKDIKLGSTIKLSEDIIKNLPVNIIDISTNKLFFKYSILVRQYALSREAFEYWTDLAKTTQGTGSLFDPQPSQVTGNIKNAGDPKELVFGYFSAVNEEKQRIFLSPALGRFPTCIAPDTLEPADAYKSYGVLLNSLIDAAGRTFILSSSEECADCRSQGGTTTRPSFWK
ncbi:DUF4249 domain-containing protein [Dyadobacter sp. LJ53]|uniref:DUF4249 domain-containing protein n=1 Tax=Dyadobacter chenwenxiniae TaxID=2906456 RepID=UPI001F37C68B|nr:DUF4249 domain-containing protein [Dyadobacter chenwenxiniae]MCF0053064.1 DUF4249 domain-containing protein [Dyadobacter chenwenxiniae]